MKKVIKDALWVALSVITFPIQVILLGLVSWRCLLISYIDDLKNSWAVMKCERRMENEK